MDLSPGWSVQQVMVREPVMVAPQLEVREVVQLMNRHRIGAVLVGADDRLVGIFTERDLLRHAVASPPGWRQRPVADWMTREPLSINPRAGWEEALALMDRLHVRHLPVVDDGRVVGILSARDLIARRAQYLDRLVEERTRALRQVNRQLANRDAELRHHLAMAGRLQARLLLPGAPPAWPEIAWGIHYAPLDSLGGDYYDFAVPDDQHLGILIADASGHSLPAAMVAIMARTAFTSATRTPASPAAVLAAMNRHLHGLTDERFVTAFYGVLDRPSRRFTYANAGHPFPLHYAARTGRCQALGNNSFMLGIVHEADFEESCLDLDVGDKLCFVTDGALDCQDELGETFGAQRLEEHFLAAAPLPAEPLSRQLVERLAAFRGRRPLNDDLTLLVAEVTG
jgi:serine phosphatase RsbU (regulator of sigma subunit)